jgi:SAM-dependent methyltransferase
MDLPPKWLRAAIPKRIRWAGRNMAAKCRLVPCLSGTHDGMTAEQIVARARDQIREYFDFGHIHEDALSGQCVLEVGPGNNLCVALLLLACGAGRVVCIDRFPSRPNPAQSCMAYAALYDHMTEAERARCADVFTAGSVTASRDAGRKLVYLWDCEVEEADRRLGAERFDLILSAAVLEHVYSVEAAIRSMWSLLRPGGRMIHRVDLRSHDDDQRHPLEFLTYSPRWWRLMTSHTGEPNRVREGTYWRVLGEQGFEIIRRKVTHWINCEDVQSIRHRLAAPFRDLPKEELMHAGIMFEAWKPMCTNRS